MPASTPDPDTDPQLTPLVSAGLQLFGWTVYGGIYYLSLRGYQPFVDIAVKQALVAAVTGLVASSFLGWAYNQAEVYGMTPGRKTATLLGGAAGGGLLWAATVRTGSEWVDPFIAPVAPLLGVQGQPLVERFAAFPLVLLAWSLLYLGIMHWREQRRQQARILQADADAQRARLRMLRYQLNPHFFFNALNTIGALSEEAPERVKDVVHELSGFLRYTLLDDDEDEVALRDEIDAAEHYLAVEKIRFEEDLQVEIDVGPEAARRTVPAFLVLPLVENAVKHGQRTSPSPLRINISGRITDEGLVVEVANTGEWTQEGGRTKGTATGLENVRARLDGRYPDAHELSIVEEAGRVRVRIEIDETAPNSHE